MAVEREPKHTLGRFDVALQDLQRTVLTMGSITQRHLEDAYRGLIERNSDICSQIIGEDDEVDELEKVTDREGMELILRFAPVACDLRRVLGSMRIATNLERMSDQAVNIARRVRKLNKHPEVAEAKLVEPLFRAAIDSASNAMRVFVEGDLAQARAVIKADQDLDEQHDQLIKLLTRAMEDDRTHLKTYLHLVFLARALERVGDHAENICEDCIFIEIGTDVRHEREVLPVERKGP